MLIRCPHAVIRPFLLSEEELKNAPEGTTTKKAQGKSLEGLQFRMQVSVLDCTGCGNCADVCPAPKKALEMKPLGTQLAEAGRWEYMTTKVGYKDTFLPKNGSVKNSQFAQPLFEFSGACAGCGETPYIKLITQLFGDRMMVANATDVRPSMAAPLLPCLIAPIKKAKVHHGQIRYLKTMPNSV